MTMLSFLGVWLAVSVPAALTVGVVLAAVGKEAHRAPAAAPAPAQMRRAA